MIRTIYYTGRWVRLGIGVFGVFGVYLLGGVAFWLRKKGYKLPE